MTTDTGYIIYLTCSREYLDSENKSPFGRWFERLGVQAALKVNTYVTRIENVNFSQAKSLGSGIHEC